MHSRTSAIVAVAATSLIGGCAAPITQTGSVSPQLVLAEQQKQEQLALQAQLRAQQRLDDVAYPLLAAAAPFCSGELARRAGLRFATTQSFTSSSALAARSLGISDTLTVTSVSRGSAARDLAGTLPFSSLRIGASASAARDRRAD